MSRHLLRSVQRAGAAALLFACLRLPAAALAVPESFAPVARELKPTVVNIFSSRTVREPMTGEEPNPNEPFDEFFRHFFGEGQPRRPHQQRSLGSGFIISSDGYIATNAHVVQHADQIRVKLSSGDEFDAKLIGSDAKTDVALIKIAAPESLPVVRFGDSDALEVGDWVLAIGNPFGLSATVTAGIVSAKGRVIGAGPYDDFIQTDASINPGNSGGPLINTRGEVVGINSAILSRSGGNVGIGFAIPINMAHHIIEALRQHGKVVRGWLGVSIQDLTPALAQSFGLEHARGALVVDVDPNGPAAKAGIERGDIIVAYDGTPVDEAHRLPALVADTRIGDSARLQILRNGGEHTMTVRVAEQPSGGVTREARRHTRQSWGLTLTTLTPGLARRFEIPAGVHGVLVEGIEPGSPADNAGMQPGDVIRQVNHQAVTSVHGCQQALDRSGDRALLLIQRGTEASYMVLSRGR